MSPNALSQLTLNDPEKSKSPTFQRRISNKGADLGHMLLLNTKVQNQKSHLTLSDIERSKSMSLIQA